MYIAILGRQPQLGMAELEQIYGSEATNWFGGDSAIIDTDQFDFEQLGGSQKAGRIIDKLSTRSWHDVSRAIIDHYLPLWQTSEHKITLGISTYGWNVSPRELQKTGIILKKKLREYGVSLRLIPNQQAALNTATSHHNKLGLSPNKIELLVVHSEGRAIIAESIGSQNITALAARDQARPHTDAFVGMLPPKLARMMINMAVSQKSLALRPSSSEGSAFPAEREQDNSSLRSRVPEENDGSKAERGSTVILDPFCGTGVILQEALLLGYDAYGSDLSEKMVSYSTKNLKWFTEKARITGNYTVELGDAMTHQWLPPIDAIVTEAYLGQPFSVPPSDTKLREVRGNCNHIIGSFLTNIALQVAPGTPVCLAVPAWNDGHDNFAHLPLVDSLQEFGFTRIKLKNVPSSALLYYRPDQIVGRELLLMQKA